MMRNETSMKNWFEELQAIGSHLKVSGVSHPSLQLSYISDIMLYN